MTSKRFTLLLCLLLTTPAIAQTVQSLKIDHDRQKDLALTVYNDFALVRDSREVVLPKGELLLEFEEVAQTLEPSSVAISNDGRSKLDVLEQSYRYDLLNRQSLLDTYIGRKLKYSRTVLQGDTYEKVLREGILLSTNPEIVDFGDEIEISPEGVISLPDVPDGLTLSPTLVWRLINERTGEQAITTSYIANRVSWRADYVLSIDEQDNTLRLTSWATVKNDSGTSFEDVSMRLIAGSVSRASKAAMRQFDQAETMAMRSAGPASGTLTGSESNAYQAYDLPNRTTLLNHESKQLKFLQANDVSYEQTYRVRSQLASYANGNREQPQVISEIAFDNVRSNQLGLPLAEGTARVYRDSEEAPDLLGETRLAATPNGQEVTLVLGQAFDISAKRVQTDFSRINDRSFEASYEITLSNARGKAQEVVVEELMQGDWELQESTHPLEKVSSQMAGALIKVPAEGSVVFSYRVRVKF
jgi:hypothetical protein